MPRRFAQVDVFTGEPLLGNPLAVVIDSEGLTTEQMQAFTSWTNLSEATFLREPQHPDADYSVRIFDPHSEMPFAGHPTLGSCSVWLENGGQPKRDDVIVQECAIGLVEIKRDGSRLAFAAPPFIKSGPVDEDLAAKVLEVLGVSPFDIVDIQWLDNGPGWIGVLFKDAETVLALQPDFGSHLDLEIGVAGPYPPASESAIEVRAFFRGQGAAAEDPVTGSLNAGFAMWLLDEGLLSAPYVASQGTRLGRRGRVYVDRDEQGVVWIGGEVTPIVGGSVEF